MRKLTAKNLVDFRHKSDPSKKRFVQRIKEDKKPEQTDGGGDYWTISLSAICNSLKENDLIIVKKKISEVSDKLKGSKHTISKTMYQRNIDLLESFLRFDQASIFPPTKISFLKKSSASTLFVIRGMEVEVDAKRFNAFVFDNKGSEEVGAVWVISQLHGYQKNDIVLFCEMLYKFLQHNYAKKYRLNAEYCIALDISSIEFVSYDQIGEGGFEPVLIPTLNEVTRLL
jgi:hypothetical protein